MKELNISAGGKNLRLRDFLSKDYGGIPKHVLPIPKLGSIIEKIILEANSEFDRILIHANNKNAYFFKALFKKETNIKICIDMICNGPLGPCIRDLKNNETSYSCAGDLVCDAKWKDIISFHKSHNLPVTILVAKSTPVPGGARFKLRDNIIESWERVAQTDQNDVINIGYYIFNKELLSFIKEMPLLDENNLFKTLVPQKKIAAYLYSDLAFNVNTPISYKKMCEFYSKKI